MAKVRFRVLDKYGVHLVRLDYDSPPPKWITEVHPYRPRKWLPKVAYKAREGAASSCLSCRRILKVLRQVGLMHPGGLKLILGMSNLILYRHLKRLVEAEAVDRENIEPRQFYRLVAKAWIQKTEEGPSRTGTMGPRGPA